MGGGGGKGTQPRGGRVVDEHLWESLRTACIATIGEAPKEVKRKAWTNEWSDRK